MAAGCRRARNMRPCWKVILPIGVCASTGWSPILWNCRSRICGTCRSEPRSPALPPNTVQRVVDLALGPPPGESTHWTGRELAKTAGVSLRSVQRILEAHQLAPHRIRTFKLSKDPEFVEKLRDIVGLYVDPPAHAVVLPVDEKS